MLKMNMNQVPYVRSIEVFTDNNLVFGFQMTYDNNFKTKSHFGSHAHQGVQLKRVDLAQGELLVGAGGRFGDLCDQLWFVTSQGRKLTFGGPGGQEVTYDT